MLAAIRHRGPDGEGVVVAGRTVVGAVRLAIFDPERGHQPMESRDGRHVVVLNGAIVNHVELRSELEAEGVVFRTRCDTEVLLELLAREGVAGLARVDGMFALAFLDTVTGELLLARDPCGIKPLYWAEQGDWTGQQGRLLFASEPKALLAADGLTARLDEDRLLGYLEFQQTSHLPTFFDGVRCVPPGRVLLCRPGHAPRLAPLPQWHAPPEVPGDRDAAAEVLRGLLRESARRHLRADVALGSHLSGGTDSSLVAALAARALPEPVHTFTGAFDVPGFDERGPARAVAEEIGALRHEVIVTPEDLAEALPAAARAMDEPAGGPGLLPQWCVARLASQHVKVVLGGQGGDELFAGYVRHLLVGMAERVRRGESTRRQEMNAHAGALSGYGPLLARFGDEGWREDSADAYFRLAYRGAGLAEVLSGDLRRRFRERDPRAWFRARFRGGAGPEREGRTAMGDAARFDRATLLPSLLHVEDRTSMAWSLESRVPLLGRPVLSFVDRLPDAWLTPGGVAKGLLRRAIAPDLPTAAAARRDKMGFPVPLAAWARGPLRELFRDLLLDRTARERGLFDPAGVERVLAGESVEARHLWAMVNVELWMREHAA